MPMIRIITVPVGPKLLSSGTTTTITSSTTFVAGAAGVYRVLVVGSGATGGSADNGVDSVAAAGGGSGVPAYAEIELTADENVSVTVAAAASGVTGGVDGNDGNLSSFGDYVVTSRTAEHGAGVSPYTGGDGWAGGGAPSTTSDGGTLGNDGERGGSIGGRGMGSGLTAFLLSRFSGVVLSSGTAGAQGTATDPSHSGGGGAGLLIDGAGPAGSAATTSRGGKGEGYGGGSGGGDNVASEDSNPGVVIVEGPYSE